MAKSSPKTVPTQASVKDFIAQQDDAVRRADCTALVKMMEKATGEKACMWGSAIVGFATYRYAYANGSTGDWPVVAFSPRKNDLTVYLMPGFENQTELLARLGKHKTGKVCLYLKRLADVDLDVLQVMINLSVQAMAPQRIFKGKKP
jgi:hypothetical protein